jgi:hypothetical protein
MQLLLCEASGTTVIPDRGAEVFAGTTAQRAATTGTLQSHWNLAPLVQEIQVVLNTRGLNATFSKLVHEGYRS